MVRRRASLTDFTPSVAPISVLAFLGTGFVLVICVLIALHAALRRSKILLAIAGTGGIVVAAAYLEILLGFSLFSREVDLPIGAKKYFCEIDCLFRGSGLDAQKCWRGSRAGYKQRTICGGGIADVV